MPSFLSKLLGRKKVQESESSADKCDSPTLLEGKFEAVSPTVSPSAAHFTDPGVAQIRGDDKAKDKESPFNILRYKSRPSSPTAEKPVTDIPQLSLTLPVTKDRGRALDVVFEPGHETVAFLDQAAVGERRLSPDEALSLVRACSQVIIERGLDTLGIMHPHWYSASPKVQHRLISLYLLSLASKSPNSATSPTGTSPTSTSFESELRYTHSPHDVAAVLRWGLRHLKLDGASFGKESGDWTWYNTFATAERTSSFPPDAFSQSLIPQLPPAHTELLLATLDIVSFLSAHGEANGSSGSRLSKSLGLWLLTAERSLDGDDWTTFYDRWDRAGRILEHLFLARIRDEAHELPRRLTELVEHYPYASSAGASNNNLLPRPRFSTRDYDALFVRLDTEYTGALKPKSHPLRLIAEALRAQSAPKSATVEDADLWDTIKNASIILDTPEGTYPAYTEPIPNVSNVFSDETIRLLSLVPVDAPDTNRPIPTFVLLSPISPGRPRSFSFPDSPRSPTQIDHGRASSSVQPALFSGLNANPCTAPTTASPVTPTDWLQFSSQGFGITSPTQNLVASLWDNDVEVTVPPPAPLSHMSSQRAHSRRSSIDSPSAQTHVSSLSAALAPSTSKATLIARVKLNEAFVDFWADALLDPVSRPWLRFVLCQLKPLPSVVTSQTPTPTWLIIEQRFVRPAQTHPPKEEVEAPTTPPRPRASSPRPSLRAETSRLSAAFSFSPKMRFGFFAGSSGDSKSPNEKSARLSQVGELGESAKDTRGAAVVEGKPKESDTSAKDGVHGNVALATASASAVAAAATSVVTVAAIEEISPAAPTEGASPALADETAPSVSATITKIDEPTGDQPTTAAMHQNEHTQDSHIEEQRTLEPEVAPVSHGGAHSNTTSEPAAAETGETVSETKTAQPAVESALSIPYLARISEGPIQQPDSVPAAVIIPADEVSPPPEPASIAEELSAPESSAVPLVDESQATERNVSLASSDPTFVDSPANSAIDEVVVTPTTSPAEAPEPTVEDPGAVTSDVADPVTELVSVVEEPNFADTSILGPVPATAEYQLTPAPDTMRVSDVSELATSTFEQATTSHVGEAGPAAPSTTPSPTDTDGLAQDLSAETTTDAAQERIALSAREESQLAEPTAEVATPAVEEAPPAADTEQPAVSDTPPAPADKPTITDDASASDKDWIDVAPVAVGIAENFPVAEASVESDVLKSTLEAPEHLATKPEFEPSVAEPETESGTARDSEELLHTSGSAQNAIEEPTTNNAPVVTVIAPVDEPVVSRPAVLVAPKVDSVEEQLATTSEPEALVEGTAAPALEEAIPIIGESAHPTAVKVETPPVAEEPAVFNVDAPAVNTDATSTEAPALVAVPAPTVDATPAATDILAETPAPAIEGILPSTVTPVAEVTTETSIPAAIEATPSAETPIKTLTPVIDESRPAPQTDAPTTAEAPIEAPAEKPPAPTEELPVEEAAEATTALAESSTLEEEDSHVAEEAIPTAEIPVDPPLPEVQSSNIVTDEAAHTVGTHSGETLEPAAEGPVHVSQAAAPVVADPDVLAETLVPVAAEEQTAITEEAPLAADTHTENLTPVVEDASPPHAITSAELPVDPPLPEVQPSIPVTDEAAHAAGTPPGETLAPAVDEPVHISQAAVPVVAEPDVLAETLVPAAEEQTAITEEAALAADTCTENLTPVAEGASPSPHAITPAELPIETVPVAEESILTEAAPNADTPEETVVAAEAIHAVFEAPPETPVHIQTPELSEPASAPETPEAPPPVTEAPAAPIPEERSLVIDDAAEAPSETVSPAAEESAPLVSEETGPVTTETIPDVDVSRVAEDPTPMSDDTPSDIPVPVDEPAPTLGQSESPVAEIPAPAPEEPAPVPEEEAVPVVVEQPAETTAPVAGEITFPSTEQATLATIDTPAAPIAPTIEESTLTTDSPLAADTPAESSAPVPGEPAPVSEESAPDASPDAEQPLVQEESTAHSTEEQAPPAQEHLSDQPETVVAESVQVTEEAVQEAGSHVEEEAPPMATDEEPVVQEPESVPGTEIVASLEVDASVEEPVSNGTGAPHANPGREPELKPETELDPTVTDEQLDVAS